MAAKTQSTPSKPAPSPEPVDWREMETVFGHTQATRLWEPIERMSQEEREDTDELEQIKARAELRGKERAFYHGRLRAAIDAVRNVDLAPIFAVKLYDADLRTLLEGGRKKGPGWTDFAGGATDQEIADELAVNHGGYDVVVNGYVLLADRLMGGVDDRREDGLTVGDTQGTVVLKGKELITEVRRLLSIPPAGDAAPPNPTKRPAPTKPAKKTTTAAKGLSAKAAKKTREVDSLASPTKKGWGPWAKKVREALKRRGIADAVAPDVVYWVTHHAAGLSPAEAVNAQYPKPVTAAATIPDAEVELSTGDRDEPRPAAELKDSPAPPARMSPDVVELHNLGGPTWDDVADSFSAEKVKRGDPSKVAEPVWVGDVAYLYMGIFVRDKREVARLVALVPEAGMTPEAIAEAKENAAGYSGRTVQTPNGTRYLIAGEAHNLLVYKPATESADGRRRGT